MQQQTIPTTAALSVVGVPHSVWRSARDRGWFRSGPVKRGRDQEWSVDEMTCLSWYYALYTCGMKRPMAGDLARLLQEAMLTHPTVETLNVYAWSDDHQARIAITTSPPPEARGRGEIIFVVPVTAWRDRVKAAVAAYHAGRKAAGDA